MGIVRKGITKGMTGRIGDTSYYSSPVGTIVRDSASTQTNPQSAAQMTQRVSLAPLVAFWRATAGTLYKAFQGRRPGTSDYNNFVSMNFTGHHGYMTRQEVESGVSFLSDFWVTRGTLLPIGMFHTNSGYITDIGLGPETFVYDSSICDVSRMIIENNEDFKEGDCLVRFAFGYSPIDGDGRQRVVCTHAKLRLSLTDTRQMVEAGLNGWFEPVESNQVPGSNYVLGGWASHADVGCVTVHTRKSKKGILVSPQRIMESHNSYGAEHKTSAFRKLAILSYTDN